MDYLRLKVRLLLDLVPIRKELPNISSSGCSLIVAYTVSDYPMIRISILKGLAFP